MFDSSLTYSSKWHMLAVDDRVLYDRVIKSCILHGHSDVIRPWYILVLREMDDIRASMYNQTMFEITQKIMIAPPQQTGSTYLFEISDVIVPAGQIIGIEIPAENYLAFSDTSDNPNRIWLARKTSDNNRMFSLLKSKCSLYPQCSFKFFKQAQISKICK